jgi:alanine dehydrogenase
MDIGVTREIKAQEGRVALMPREVRRLVDAGHRVRVETKAGFLSGVSDDEYISAGAEILNDMKSVYAENEMIVKVKEILPDEYDLLEKHHIIYTNIHSASNRELTDLLLNVGLSGISAEDTHQDGSPNCPLAGEVGAFEGVRLCMAPYGGVGRHFMPHFGAPALKAVVIGLGLVGQGAVRTLVQLGASVTGLDINSRARKNAALTWSGTNFRADDVGNLSEYLDDVDLIINCVLWPKHRDDHLISRAMLKNLKPTTVIVDISCDEGGAIETCRGTSWDDPVYEVDGIRHFCVDNIPGAVPVTASAGYSQAIYPFVSLIADIGVIEACKREPWLTKGLTCHDGNLILAETARVQERDHLAAEEYLARF